MAKKFNPSSYNFVWLANKVAELLEEKGNISLSAAAESIDRTASTLTNWLNGVHLESTILKPNQKDDVAGLIANLLKCDIEEVRHQIHIFLQSQGKLPVENSVPNYKDVVAELSRKIKNLYYYDKDTVLSPEKRELISAVFAVLEKI